MAKSHGKNKGRTDAPGGFAGIPRIVLKHPDYQGLSGGAVKLLIELASQFKGNNNGNLTVAFSILKKRGFNSKSTIARSVKELLSANIIIQTREGRFTNPGGVCNLYALSWLAIDECPGKSLTASPTVTPPRKFSLEFNKTPGPETGPGSVQKQGRCQRRDGRGQYSSVQKQGRLTVVT
ncbi:hypothetical protein G8764_06315 [Pseudomaricurvus alcaniphilus]|uniref:hypothetical protein n=1 Tax=Pseudomaricurvus alcaniphilus TaxID=1166482 RepID=UPI00140CFFC1|nr:hypothetical protein [Pseudomaricurvus alcaniphilus]NHN36900.1 hypothetical protein [Pseudomaricurvus alcaniphilus]